MPVQKALPQIEPWMGIIVPSQREPRASGLYRVVTRNSPLSVSGRSKAQKSHRVTHSRFVERTSTKRRKSSFDVMLFVISRSNRSRSRSSLNSSSRHSRSSSSSRNFSSVCFRASMSVAVPNPQELSRLVSEWIDPAEKPTEHPVMAAKPRLELARLPCHHHLLPGLHQLRQVLRMNGSLPTPASCVL